jgi:hypothetical protein
MQKIWMSFSISLIIYESVIGHDVEGNNIVSSCHLCDTLWRNKWRKEEMKEGMKECMNEGMKEWVNAWMKEWRNEGMHEWSKEWMNEGIKDWMNEGTKECNKECCLKTSQSHQVLQHDVVCISCTTPLHLQQQSTNSPQYIAYWSSV